MTLDQLVVGEQAVIKAVNQNDISPKLMDMGLYPGKAIQMVFKAPFGDPLAVDVEGYTLSLRKKEASLVELA